MQKTNLGKNPQTNIKALVKYRQKERASYGGLSCVNNNHYGEPCKSTFVCLLISLTFIRRRVFGLTFISCTFFSIKPPNAETSPAGGNKAALRKEIKLDAEKELCFRKTSFHISSKAFIGFRLILGSLYLFLSI